MINSTVGAPAGKVGIGGGGQLCPHKKLHLRYNINQLSKHVVVFIGTEGVIFFFKCKLNFSPEADKNQMQVLTP